MQDFLKEMLVNSPKEFKKFIKLTIKIYFWDQSICPIRLLSQTIIYIHLNAFKDADEIDVDIRNYLEENEECHLVMIACGPTANCIMKTT